MVNGTNVRNRNMLGRMGYRKAAMTRREWLQKTGLAAAGVGATAVGLGGVAHAKPGNVYRVETKEDFQDRVTNAIDGDVLILQPQPNDIWDYGTYDNGNWISGPQWVTNVSLTVKCEDSVNKAKIKGLGCWYFYSEAYGTKWNFENVEIEHYGVQPASPNLNWGDYGHGIMVFGGQEPNHRASFSAKGCTFHGEGTGIDIINEFGPTIAEIDEPGSTTYIDQIRFENCTCIGEDPDGGCGIFFGYPLPDANSGVDINNVYVSDCIIQGAYLGLYLFRCRVQNGAIVKDNKISGSFFDFGVSAGEYENMLVQGNVCNTGMYSGIWLAGTHTSGPDYVTIYPDGYIRNSSFIDNDCTWGIKSHPEPVLNLNEVPASDGYPVGTLNPNQRAFIVPIDFDENWNPTLWYFICYGYDLYIQECQYSNFAKNNAPFVKLGEIGERLVDPTDPENSETEEVIIKSNNNVYIDFNPENWVEVTTGSENNTINAVGQVKKAAIANGWPQWAIDQYNNMK